MRDFKWISTLLVVFSIALFSTACFESEDASWDLAVNSVSVDPGSFLPGKEGMNLQIEFVNNGSETSPDLAGTITTTSEYVTIEEYSSGGSTGVVGIRSGNTGELGNSPTISVSPDAPLGTNIPFEIKFVEHRPSSTVEPDMNGKPAWTGGFSLTLERSGWDIEIESVEVMDFFGRNNNDNRVLNPGEAEIPLT